MTQSESAKLSKKKRLGEPSGTDGHSPSSAPQTSSQPKDSSPVPAAKRPRRAHNGDVTPISEKRKKLAQKDESAASSFSEDEEPVRRSPKKKAKGKRRTRRRGAFVRNPWSEDEDAAIAGLVSEHGTTRWSLIAHLLKEKCRTRTRTGKQCRERYLIVLN